MEEAAAAVLPSVQTAAVFNFGTAALSILERIIAMFIHIGLTVIVSYGVFCAKKICLPTAILLHMLEDTFAALYQRNAVLLCIVEVWVALWTAVIFVTVHSVNSNGQKCNKIACGDGIFDCSFRVFMR